MSPDKMQQLIDFIATFCDDYGVKYTDTKLSRAAQAAARELER